MNKRFGVAVVGAALCVGAAGCSDDSSKTVSAQVDGTTATAAKDVTVTATIDGADVDFPGGSPTCAEMSGAISISAGALMTADKQPNLLIGVDANTLEVQIVSITTGDLTVYVYYPDKGDKVTATKDGEHISVTGVVRAFDSDAPAPAVDPPATPFTVDATCSGI